MVGKKKEKKKKKEKESGKEFGTLGKKAYNIFCDGFSPMNMWI